MGATRLKLVALGPRSVESCLMEVERVREQIHRANILCRLLASGGEALDEDDREIFVGLIVEMNQDTEARFVELTRHLRTMKRTRRTKDTIKNQEEG